MKIWIAVMTGKFVIKDDLSILDCNDSNTHGIKVLLSEYRALDRRLMFISYTMRFTLWNELHRGFIMDVFGFRIYNKSNE